MRKVGSKSVHNQDRDRIGILWFLQFFSECSEQSEEDQDYMCLLRTAVRINSSRTDELIAATGLSRHLVELVIARMQRSGIWVNDGVDLEEFIASPLNELEVYCHLHWGVAKGQVIRTKDRREGRYIYAHVAADAR